MRHFACWLIAAVLGPVPAFVSEVALEAPHFEVRGGEGVPTDGTCEFALQHA